MRVALITPRCLGPDANPGWFMITNGIRRLVQLAVADAQFVIIDMMADNIAHWAAAATCDAAILCGNPRFTTSHDSWWEGGIWDRLVQLETAGIKVIDGWSGSAFRSGTDYTVDEMAAEIMAVPRNQKYIHHAAMITGRITRDPLMQRIYERAEITSVQLPCSSWWAVEVTTGGERPRHAISLMALNNRLHVARHIHTQMTALADKPVDLIASTWNDYVWARGAGLRNVQLLCDPETLLAAYRMYDKFFTFRIHAAIPAAACGCQVHVVAIDTRATACHAFDIPSTPVHELNGPVDYRFGQPPDDQLVINTLQAMLD